jgi:DNA repair protein RecO (recombination protein O)
VPSPHLLKTEAIVLRHRPLGEADRLLTLLTPHHGKVEAKAKGVRRTKSRMGGHLQPLTRVLVQLALGRTRYVVAGCQTMEAFPSLQADLDRLGLAIYLCELADRFLPQGAEAQGPYLLLLETLRRLEKGHHPQIWARRFEACLLRLSGFGPELDRCLACGHPLPAGGGAFSPVAGGTLCPLCAHGAPPISGAALRALRLLQRGTAQQVAGLRLPPTVAQEVEAHLRGYIAHLLEGEAASLRFLDKLRYSPLISAERW